MIASARLSSKIRSEIPARKRRLLIDGYMSGLSVWSLQVQYPHLRRRAVYLLLQQAGVLRTKGETQLGDDPDEAEIARRRDSIKNSWTDEQASRRWVGRSTSKMAEMGHCLSQLIPN